MFLYVFCMYFVCILYVFCMYFLLACDWSKRSTFPNIPQLKLGDI